MDGFLILETGEIFRGTALGFPATRTGELVFTTAMTGYQEVLTDPSFCGQIVIMSFPHIGNTGLVHEEIESHRPWVEGFIIHEASPYVSRSGEVEDLHRYLHRWKIPCISGCDTRYLVHLIREKGALRALITTERNVHLDELKLKVRHVPKMEGQDLTHRVSTTEPYWAIPEHCSEENWTGPVAREHIRHVTWLHALQNPEPSDKWVALFDYGVKHNILRHLLLQGLKVLVLPARFPLDRVMSWKPDGLVLSNGPGDPFACRDIYEDLKTLRNECPILAICLGHQLMALALEARTYKLHFGHRGINQPVYDTLRERVLITTQNHGFAVDPDTLPSYAKVTHWHLNDDVLEGFCVPDRRIFAYQFHPEAGPGPHDAQYIFKEFVQSIFED